MGKWNRRDLETERQFPVQSKAVPLTSRVSEAGRLDAPLHNHLSQQLVGTKRQAVSACPNHLKSSPKKLGPQTGPERELQVSDYEARGRPSGHINSGWNSRYGQVQETG